MRDGPWLGVRALARSAHVEAADHLRRGIELLHTLLLHPGRVLSRDFLLEHTRGREAGPFDRTIDVQVGRLRKKLEVTPADPQIIKSVRGAGYILVPTVSVE